ncbi:hypothetical protein [Enterococcus sp. HY326]|uniref:hypothetical protein n=1 Tax=Enterococcus sp. HY326 TaxID=2971265 RepID=UPI0022404673|nr:hypothetical protein [Enterococcus sp. HY326]
MAKTYGNQEPIPSALGQKFAVGETVMIEQDHKSEAVVIVRLLTNSAIVSLDKSGSNEYEQLNNKTVINYSRIKKIK